ncbi:MAG: hypothetical protein ACFFDF_15830 [Candidatus Odinarchaeota archaeon]
MIFPKFQDIGEIENLYKIERFLHKGILLGEQLISLNTKMEKKKERELLNGYE